MAAIKNAVGGSEDTCDPKIMPILGTGELYYPNDWAMSFWHTYAYFLRQVLQAACEPEVGTQTTTTMGEIREAIRRHSGHAAESYVYEQLNSRRRLLRAKEDLRRALLFGAEKLQYEITHFGDNPLCAKFPELAAYAGYGCMIYK